MSGDRWPTSRPRNMFSLLPPGPHIIERAMLAGVDTTSRAAIRAWREAGEPDHDGVCKR
jgi:hypothetical protein